MITFYCQNVWDFSPTNYRNKLIHSLISQFDADICLFQEYSLNATCSGELPLPELLKGVYDEAYKVSEGWNFTPVFYKREKFNLIDSGYFYYDGFNDENSKSVTWAVLEQKESSVKFGVIATHFWWMFESEKDNEQRLENVNQLTEICDFIKEKYNVPIVVGGDLNNGKNAEQGEEPYKYMLTKGFSDVRFSAEETTDKFTHHDYPVLNDEGIYVNGTLPVRTLDYIFTYGDCPVNPKKFDVITTQVALDSSDHCPVIAQIEF
ncbi:MAG: hypothetical protein IKW02_02745 [Clostridia bacterium]|nr:hypothetical protein [Clostridia bacterium]